MSVDAEALGPLDDPVINVCEVLDVLDVVAAELEVATYDVEDDIAHGVAHVAHLIGSYAADVHPDRITDWLEFLDFP
jgi:hypothetical protein